MKILKTVVVIAFIFSILESCTSIGAVSGRYSNVFAQLRSEELVFSRNDRTFEYASRTEGGVEKFSSGDWEKNKKRIFLNGFNEGNIHVLNIQSEVHDAQTEKRSKVIVHYVDDSLDTFTKADVVLNEEFNVRIFGDTTFFIDNMVKVIRIKSYLSHQGVLFSNPPSIDTLYSTVINISDPSTPKTISLQFDVDHRDFYRVLFADTLHIKNNHTLLFHNREFKKQSK